MEEARRFLGHPHLLSGQVVQGKGLGHTLGFPTVNLPFPEGVLVPAHGVYAARVWVGNTPYTAAVNIGVRPTVEQAGQVNLEAFLLDFQGDLYDRSLRVELYHFIRGEKRFESVQALTAEVLRNAEQVREYFAQLRE
jgi:riboflavin kinase/FMN adenylyltransferase